MSWGLSSSDSLACVGGALCTYSQLSDTAGQAAITSLTKGSDTTIVITGTDFVTADTATVSFQAIEANTVVVDSVTQVTATFTDGVPLTASGATG